MSISLDTLQFTVLESVINNANYEDLLKIKDKVDNLCDKRWVDIRTNDILETEMTLWKDVPGLYFEFDKKVFVEMCANGHTFRMEEGDFLQRYVKCDGRIIPTIIPIEGPEFISRNDLKWMSIEMYNQLSGFIHNIKPIWITEQNGCDRWKLI
jgi:hypothetical protein